MSKKNILIWILFEILVFGFLMFSLETLYLKEVLLQTHSSNWSIGYMVRKIIHRYFQWYMVLH
jgi:hypothetical protein